MMPAAAPSFAAGIAARAIFPEDRFSRKIGAPRGFSRRRGAARQAVTRCPPAWLLEGKNQAGQSLGQGWRTGLSKKNPTPCALAGTV
jgi:hypothetical protein